MAKTTISKIFPLSRPLNIVPTVTSGGGPDELRAYTEAEVVEDAVGAQWIATTQQHVCILCHFFQVCYPPLN